MKANKYRGYYDFPIGDGETKKMHFSMNFIFLLQDISGKNLTDWLTELQDADETAQSFALCQMVFAGLAAYDLEEENEIDYNVYKVRNWLFEALVDDQDIATELMDVMSKSLGKHQAKKK